jgi:hypothetical protein
MDVGMWHADVAWWHVVKCGAHAACIGASEGRWRHALYGYMVWCCVLRGLAPAPKL